MREWKLGPGDPLALTLAADFRLCTPDYGNDHTWELELGGGDPPATGLRTTYGLRARNMRIFPRFQVNGRAISDPADFATPPSVRTFAPNYLLLAYAPFPGLPVEAEFWVPDSHTAAGRLTISNNTGEPLSLMLELCGQLVPLEGQPLAAAVIQSVHILSGRSAELAPVIFLSGGPVPGQGPYPSLALDLALAAGGRRTLTWVQAALGTHEESFEHARRTAARPWEGERARLELVNEAQTVEVWSGDPDWDAAFALSQKTAFGLFFGAGDQLPAASFVQMRQPDQGHSTRGDGSDYGQAWNGQSALESVYLASVLTGAPELAAGLVRNFLAAQAEDGSVDWKPGLAGQRGRWLSAPLLAGLAWDSAARSGDMEFLREVFPKLVRFVRQWLEPAHDRDEDGFPEWDHALQSGLEDHPLFSVWQTASQGGDITCTETPALGAMLCREIQALEHIAEELGSPDEIGDLPAASARLRAMVEDCWDSHAFLHHLRDRDSHRSPAGKLLAKGRGAGRLEVGKSFPHPRRLLVQVDLKGASTRHLEIVLAGTLDGAGKSERLERADFHWNAGQATVTTRGLFSTVDSLEASGLEKNDKVSLRVMDLSGEDVGLFLPLWAEIPSEARARTIVSRTLFNAEHFGRPFGIPCTGSAGGSDPAEWQAVNLPWNALVGEGLLIYGFREEAAQLTTRLMRAVIGNLKTQRAFYEAHHAGTGAGLGERNAVQGLAPLGLFLKTLGVEFRLPGQVVLCGKNPFPRPVTVKYRGFTVTRQAEKTEIVFPDGQNITLDDPTDGVVSAA
jgi:hypothetical protein